MVFPGGKLKAVTFSYDDGVSQDIRFVEMLNKYGLKCTFNLNSGLQTGDSHWENRGVKIRRMNVRGLKELYAGHEIAVHALTHARLDECDLETIQNEIEQDKLNLERIFGYEIVGFAYPWGTYDERVIGVLKNNGLQYARTVMTTDNFDVQTNLMELKATCHHNSPNLMQLAEEFVALKPAEPKIFYIWGHSYEFDVDDSWDMMERFCAYISGRADIFYGTNRDVLCGR
jgi:peptidoglycan/xylan/chitin deacetylase (PgdA/CDA1 family)